LTPVTVQQVIDHASEFGQRLEDLVVARGSVKLGDAGYRDKLLLAHWSLVLDYDKGILNLMRAQFYGALSHFFAPSLKPRSVHMSF
jgi:hypothetical protein